MPLLTSYFAGRTPVSSWERLWRFSTRGTSLLLHKAAEINLLPRQAPQ